MIDVKHTTNVLQRVISHIVILVLGSLAVFTCQRLAKTIGFDDMTSETHHREVESLVLKVGGDECLKNIGGYLTVKMQLSQSLIIPLLHPHIFFDRNAPSLYPPTGILLSGPPGTGKTMFARACAHESSSILISVASSVLESKWWGDSAKILHAIFQTASKKRSCIIFFDEIDGLGRARCDADQSCVYSLKCELLRNIDSLRQDEVNPVIVLACTNHPRTIDPALLRRFPCQIKLPLPNVHERVHIIRVLNKCQPIDESLVLRIALATHGCSGADLTVSYREACTARLWDTVASSGGTCLSRGTGAEFLNRRIGPLKWNHWRQSRILSKENKGSEKTATNPTELN